MLIAAQGYFIKIQFGIEISNPAPAQYYGTITTATGSKPIAEQFGDEKVALVEQLLQAARGY